MSDYHPDGAQLFFPSRPIPFVVNLGLSKYGDDVRPENMRAFLIPAGKGVYFHPNTWHNGKLPHFSGCGQADESVSCDAEIRVDSLTLF